MLKVTTKVTITILMKTFLRSDNIGYMNSIKISVIIPVYNSERYLSQCIESILQQSFIDLEIIVINDASTDDSRAIIQHYAEQVPRIRAINLPKNSGVSTARNTGIEFSTGKYLIFVDADDYWSDTRMLETLYRQVENTSAQFITFGYCRVNELGETKKVVVQQSEVILIKEARYWKAQYNIWAKLISKKHLIDHNIKFDESLVMGEDALFSIRLFSTASKVIITDNVFYCYRENPAGATGMVWDSRKLFDTVRWMQLATDVLLAPEVRSHNTDVLQSLLIKRLMMLLNVLGPRAMRMLSPEEQADYFGQWAFCLRHLESGRLERHFRSKKMHSLYDELLEHVSQVRLAALAELFASDRYLNRKNTSA